MICRLAHFYHNRNHGYVPLADLHQVTNRYCSWQAFAISNTRLNLDKCTSAKKKENSAAIDLQRGDQHKMRNALHIKLSFLPY